MRFSYCGHNEQFANFFFFCTCIFFPPLYTISLVELMTTVLCVYCIVCTFFSQCGVSALYVWFVFLPPLFPPAFSTLDDDGDSDMSIVRVPAAP